MSVSLKQITHQIDPMPELTANIKLDAIEEIKKHLTEPHGISLIAITMLDKKNQNLKLEIQFDTEAELITFLSTVLAIWDKYEPIPSYLRSYKQDGQFMDSIDDIKLEHTDAYPTSIEQYRGKKAIIDMSLTTPNYFIIQIHRWNETNPRILILCLKPDQNQDQPFIE